MASIQANLLPSSALCHTDSNPTRSPSQSRNFVAASPRCPLSALKWSDSGLCRCRNPLSGSPSPGDDGGWNSLDSILHDVVKSALKKLEDCMNSFRKLSGRGGLNPENADAARNGEETLVGEDEDEKDWDWKRWKQHFLEIEENKWIALALKMQLSDAVSRDDYEAAAKFKLALHAANRSDTVGSAIVDYNKAIAEERYNDAAFLRDNAGTGLLGWWSGISEDGVDIFGRIIHISAEHGKYVARNYSSRQLAMSRPGFPLFEVYFTYGSEGYKKQAVYLKQNIGRTTNMSMKSANNSAQSLNQSNGLTEEPREMSSEVDDNSNWIDGLIIKSNEESDEETQDSEEKYIKAESDLEETEMVSRDEASNATEEQNQVSMKFVISTLLKNMAADVPHRDLVRVPAELEIRDHLSFSFSVKKEDLQSETETGHGRQTKSVTHSSQRSSDHVRPGFSKVFVAKEKMPIKVLVDIGELISLSVDHNQISKVLVGTTHFNRIDIVTTSDPLSGLYIGAHGMYTSELLYLKRRFGHWHEDDGIKKPKDLEFYEYVEAYKLSGALSIPAGQVVFRAKIGKKNQLPHKGIIPEELGVIARYRAQGRLAEPGFQNPRWVDGELIILDGKNIRSGPVIGFLYLAPEHHFLVFFNRLMLPA